MLSLALCLTCPAEASPTRNSKKQEAVINEHSLSLNERGAQAFASKNFTKAEKFFKDSLQSDPKNLSAAFNYAGVLLVQKKERQAIALLEDYAKNHSKDVGIFVRLGDAYSANKQLSKALTQYEKAFKLEPDYIGLSGKLGSLYAMQNNITLAENMFAAAVKQQPNNRDYWANLGSIQLANNKPDEAIVSARRALRIQASSDVYITLATAYESKKDFEKSLTAYKRAKALGMKDDSLDDKIDEMSDLVKRG